MEDQQLKRFECNYPNCGFQVQGDDEAEILEYAMEHAQYAHGIDLIESMQRFFGGSN